MKELMTEKEELKMQKEFFERKSISLSREVSKLISTSYINIDEIKEENSILKSKLQLRDEALESLINPHQDKIHNILNNKNTDFVEGIADESCFVFLFGKTSKEKKTTRGKSNIF
jgi:hypothetical protein